MSIKNELEKSIPATIKLTEKEKATIRNHVRQSRPSSHIHYKPLVISILFVLILAVLVSPAIQRIKEDGNTANPILPSDPSTNPLTDEQKEQYHEQYTKIIEKAMEQKVGINTQVAPIEEFKESDWIEPKEFEKNINDWMNDHLAKEQEWIADLAPYAKPAAINADGSVSKIGYMYFSDIIRQIEVTGHFTTQLNALSNRQLFASTGGDVTTKLASDGGMWEQTASQVSILDGGRTYSVRIEGVFELNGISTEKAFTVDFHCDKNGRIY